MRALAVCVILFSQSVLPGISQVAPSGKSATVSCTFDDSKEMKVQYNSSAKQENLRDGTPWGPGGSPMILFTQTALTLGNAGIPIGAYSLYIIPGKEHWTLVVNKNVAPDSKYDKAQDLARTSIETGELENPLKQPKVAFAHVGPKQCNMRLYYENTGTWAEFHEK
jgi:hypothetical protein